MTTGRYDGARRPIRGARSRLTRPRRIGKLFAIIAFSLLAASTILSLAFLLNSALKSRGQFLVDRFGIASPITFDAFVEAWQRGLMPGSMINSLVYTIGGVISLWIIATPAAYAFTQLRFPGRSLFFLVVIASVLIPFQVIMFPFFVQLRDFGLLNQVHGLILTYTVFGVPLTLFQLAAYFRSLPKEILEAARIDGAGTLRMLVDVVIPMSKPVFAVTGILNFIWMWNELLLPLLIMSKQDRQPMMVVFSNLHSPNEVNAGLVAAGALAAMVPVVVVFLIAQRQLIKGITAGAFK